MKNDIKEKLRLILSKDSFEESDVVYILSRVRKILEIYDKDNKYRKLKFYCDWALHNKIDYTNPIDDELKNFPDDMMDTHKFLMLDIFFKEFYKFLKEYNIDTSIYRNYENRMGFHQRLIEIYSDTPLIVKYTRKKIITIKAGELIKKKVGKSNLYVPSTEFKVTYEN